MRVRRSKNARKLGQRKKSFLTSTLYTIYFFFLKILKYLNDIL